MGIILKIIKKTGITRMFPKIHILSDSHGDVFRHTNLNLLFNKKRIKEFCIIQGATASGLANPNSKTKSYQYFKKYLRTKVRKKDFVLFELGEVDCGFAIWLSAEKRNLSIKEQMNYALNNYFNLIQDATEYSKNIILCSAILPTIPDNIIWGEIANKRKDVKAKQIERTNLTLLFNSELKSFCHKKGFIYLDFDSFLLNKEKGIVKETFLNKDRNNHHLETSCFSHAIEKYIKNNNISIKRI